jgi:hypothetical protein
VEATRVVDLVSGNSMVVTAFVPVFNAGRGDDDICAYDFCCGAHLSLAPTSDFDLSTAKVLLEEHDWVSRHELRVIDIAKACLYMKAEFSFSDTHDFFRHAHLAAQKLDTLLWCIDLAGGGENDHWRSAGLENCGVYVISNTTMPHTLLKPLRIPFRYKTPTEEDRMAAWLLKRLEFANTLFQALDAYKGEPIPRLTLSNRLRQFLETYNGFAWNIRLQLAVTALETFYAAPNEPSSYVWSELVMERIAQVCNDRQIRQPTRAFFNELKGLRNDVAHRAGQPKPNSSNRFEVRTLRDTEHLLTESICWGILNQQLIAEAFDKDEWPSAAFPAISESISDHNRPLDH